MSYKYKSITIDFIAKYKVANLCAFDDFYYFESNELIEEAAQISDEEFQAILARIEVPEPEEVITEPTTTDIANMISSVEETQLTQLMALADIYETIVAE